MRQDYSDLDDAILEAETAGDDQAWSMSSSYYLDPGVLRAEKDRLFAREWICIGRVAEIPSPGD